MPNRKQIAEDVLDARRTKRQVEIVEQFEARVYENMADQVYYNIKTVVDLLIDHNKEEDLIELARAFAVDDVDIKCFGSSLVLLICTSIIFSWLFTGI